MRLNLVLVVACCLLSAKGVFAATIVGPGGVLQTFDSRPPASQWSTAAVGSGAGTITSAAQLDAAVQLLSAAGITTQVGNNASGLQQLAQWNTPGHLRMRPTSIAYTALMARLENQTGVDVAQLNLSYDFAQLLNPSDVAEDVPGWRTFYSLSGSPGSWVLIPELSDGTTGALSAEVDLAGEWAEGSLLYLLWADDNGPGSGSLPGLEGDYTMDNFFVEGFAAQVIPEPASIALWCLLALAAAVYAAVSRRRSKAPA